MLHGLVLQKLNSVLTNFGAGVFYPRSTFEKVDYTGRPVIFWEGNGLPTHPDFRDVTAGRLPTGYRIVGQVCNTSIDGDIQRADALISDDDLDAEISAHPDRFAISTGFWGRIANNVMRGVDSTNHVLLFRREGISAGEPNDTYSQVCHVKDKSIYPIQLKTGFIMATNKYEIPPKQVGNAPAVEPVPDTKMENAPIDEKSEIEALREENTQLKALAEQLVAKLQEIQQAMIAAEQQQRAQQTPQAIPTPAIAPTPAAIGNVAADISAQIGNLKAENERMKKKCQDYEWEQLEKTIPVTMRGENGRREYESDPTSFMRKAISSISAVQVTNTAAEGVSLPNPQASKIQTFATQEYAYARQIGNVAPPQHAVEGSRLGPHLWALHGGMKLDSRDIDAKIALRRFGDQYGGI